MEVCAMQRKVLEFVEHAGVETSVEFRILDLFSELGELAKEALQSINYGTEDFFVGNEWENELGDVFFSLICVANTTGVDLEQCLNKTLEKYRVRLAEKGKISSQ